MDFIFMLTRQDRTVGDCLEIERLIRPLGLRHVGFKDIGVDLDTLRELTARLRESGSDVYMEVVSTTPQATLESAENAVRLGVDWLLGGTLVHETLSILAGSKVRYLPFPGRPFDHPTKLAGAPVEIADHCRRFRELGCAGADLLAYRATEADPADLVRAARTGLGDARLVVAGNVQSRERIAEIAAAGADAFTVGSAVFDGTWTTGGDGPLAQIRAILADCAAVVGHG